MTAPRPATIEREKDKVPAWVDKARLCFETCICERTVDAWVHQGLLPPPRLRGGKLMWRWSEVDQYLADGGAAKQDSPVDQQEAIRANTERATHGRAHRA